MTQISLDKTSAHPSNGNKNWPLVGSLFLLTALPGIPAVFIVSAIIVGLINPSLEIAVINTIYFETPWVILIHGISGIAFFITLPWQFSATIRHTHPKWHKVAGRIALLSAYVMAVSGIFMHHLLTPNDLGMRYFGLLVMSFGMIISFSLAFYHVLKRNIAAHKTWMYRAVAITLAIVTPLLIQVVVLFTLGQIELLKPLAAQFLHDYERLIALGMNLFIAERLLRNNSSVTEVGNKKRHDRF